ncbi:UNKNOWN [Stylonychia lemnae]|uniref:Uncharacterized protein n=1 Tax=Stylonychia lemnae TaxID=5949 RepID=A0A078AYR2_STYLE|nr:UNKNOWN [Stylonychia lemnae]|eukprot:CDW87304.1 UNKNOWN [Stylonychia lemnae]
MQEPQFQIELKENISLSKSIRKMSTLGVVSLNSQLNQQEIKPKPNKNSRNSVQPQNKSVQYNRGLQVDGLRLFFKGQKAMTKYPPFLDDCPKIDFDISTHSPPNQSASPSRQPYWNMVAKRVMSPFKEFIKYAKRHNNIPDIDPNALQEPEIQKEATSKPRETQKLQKGFRKNKASNKMRQQYSSSKMIQHSQMHMRQGPTVQFAMDQIKSSSNINSLALSKNESQLKDSLQSIKQVNIQTHPMQTQFSSCTIDSESKQSYQYLPTVKEVNNDPNGFQLSQSGNNLIKRIEAAVKFRVLQSIEKYKLKQLFNSPKKQSEPTSCGGPGAFDFNIGLKQLQSSQAVDKDKFDLKEFIHKFQKIQAKSSKQSSPQSRKSNSNNKHIASFTMNKESSKKEFKQQLMRKNMNLSVLNENSQQIRNSQKKFDKGPLLLRLYQNEIASIKSRPNRLTRIEENLDRKLQKMSRDQNHISAEYNSYLNTTQDKTNITPFSRHGISTSKHQRSVLKNTSKQNIFETTDQIIKPKSAGGNFGFNIARNRHLNQSFDGYSKITLLNQQLVDRSINKIYNTQPLNNITLNQPSQNQTQTFTINKNQVSQGLLNQNVMSLKNHSLIQHQKLTTQSEKLNAINQFANSQLQTLLFQKRLNLQLEDEVNKKGKSVVDHIFEVKKLKDIYLKNRSMKRYLQRGTLENAKNNYINMQIYLEQSRSRTQARTSQQKLHQILDRNDSTNNRSEIYIVEKSVYDGSTNLETYKQL